MLDVFAHRFILIYISHSMQLIGFFASNAVVVFNSYQNPLGKVHVKLKETRALYALLISDFSHVLI